MDLTLHLDLTSLWIGAGLGIIALFVLTAIVGAISNSVKKSKRQKALKNLTAMSEEIDWGRDWFFDSDNQKPKPKKPKKDK